MSFYKILSKYYDEVFKLQQSAVQFLDIGLKEKDKVLDMACGTFSYGLELTKKGKEVFGIDLSEFMIKKAEEKSKEYSVELFDEDIRNINVIFKDIRFKEIFCIGNSLVYLPFKSDMKDVIKKSYKILEDDGIFIIGIVNYDRVLKDKIKKLPIIINDELGINFTREYNYIENSEYIDLNEMLDINNEDENVSDNNCVKLLPMCKDELVNMIKDAGFSKISLFGDYKENEWTKDSENTIIKAWK